MRAGVIDPDFGGDGLQREADPERGAEEFGWLRFVAAQHRGGEEHSHDRADSGDGEADSVAANHPFAMLGELAAERVPECFCQRDEEKSSEESDGGFLIEAADGFAEGQLQAADAYHGACGEKNAS